MNSVNVVELLSLVLVFTAVCQTDDDVCRVSCDDVTGSVGTEVTFTCSVSQKCYECCFTMYKFQENKETFCKEEKESCDQRNTFTCRYNSTTAMMKPFTFFLQRKCGTKKAEFTVNITDSSKPDTKASGTNKRVSKEAQGLGLMFAVIAAVVSCFIIIIILLLIVYKTKEKNTLKKMFERHNDPPEQQEQSQSLV